MNPRLHSQRATHYSPMEQRQRYQPRDWITQTLPYFVPWLVPSHWCLNCLAPNALNFHCVPLVSRESENHCHAERKPQSHTVGFKGPVLHQLFSAKGPHCCIKLARKPLYGLHLAYFHGYTGTIANLRLGSINLYVWCRMAHALFWIPVAEASTIQCFPLESHVWPRCRQQCLSVFDSLHNVFSLN